MNLLSKLDCVPPFLTIAIGTQVHGLSVKDIAAAADVSLRTITRLNNCDSWEGVKARVIQDVATCCQVDLLDPRLALDLLRHSQGESKFDRLPSPQRAKVFSMFGRLQEKHIRDRD